MRVILLKDVPEVGKKYDVVTVARGYGRNFLFARGFAELATPANIVSAEQRTTRQRERIAATESQAKEIAQRLRGITLTVVRKGTKSGHLYGSVSAADIAKELRSATQLSIDPSSIQLGHPLKSAGRTKLAVKLSADTDATLTVEVKADVSKR